MSYDHHQQTAATTTSTSPPQQQHSSENNNGNNTTYRPRSPDLSAFTLPFQQQQQQNQRQEQQTLFHPSYQDPPSSTASWQLRQGTSGPALTGLPGGGGGYLPATHRGSYDASPYFSPQGSISLAQGQVQSQAGSLVGVSGGVAGRGQQQSPGPGQPQRRDTFRYTTAIATAGVTAGEYSALTYSPTTTGGERLSPETGSPSQHRQQQQQQPQVQTQGQQGFVQGPASGFTAAAKEQLLQAVSQRSIPNMAPSRRKRGQTDEHDDSGGFAYTPEPSATGGGADGKPSRKRKSDSGQAWPLGRAPGGIGPSLGIEVKTKFPVARIKRIMQADEDVGKVAQATPTAVSKALELFMITLVTKAAAEAKDRSSKRITAAHLKQAVVNDQTFDFLQDIIEKVADPTEKKGGGGGGGRAASEDVDDGAAGAPKRKRAARGKKKADSDEE